MQLETRPRATDTATHAALRGKPSQPSATPDRPAEVARTPVDQADALSGILARAVVRRAAVLARLKSGFPLADALDYEDARDARAQLGETAYATVAGWRLADLDPIFAIDDVTRRRQSIRAFAERFTGLGTEEVRTVLARLSRPLGVDAIVALTPAGARFLLGFQDRHLAYVHGVLRAVGGDVGRATTAMGLLTPHLDDPERLTIVRGVLADENYDAGAAGPIVAYFLRYQGHPVARLIARQELATAGGDVAEASREMAVLGRYNYDRHLRDVAADRAAAVAEADHGRAVAAAATARRLAELAAEAAAGEEYKRHAPKGERPKSSNKASPTKLKAIKKWDTTDAAAKEKAEAVRQDALVTAADVEQRAVAAADDARPGARDGALANMEDFLRRATAAVGEADAAFVAHTSGLDLAFADTLLGLFADHDSATARRLATWLAAFGADLPRLARARDLANAALRGGLGVALAIELADLLLTAPLSDGPRDTLIAAIAASSADFADVRTLLTTHYPARRDHAASALHAARAHGVAVALLLAFGADAHVFMAAVPADPVLLVARAPWILKLRARTDRSVAELCDLARETRNLPEDKAELLVADCATSVDGLRATDPAAYGALLTAAAGIALDELAAEAHWYWLWRVKLDQPLARLNAIVAGLPAVGERTTLAPALTSVPLSAALITARGAGAPLRWAKILKIVDIAGPGQRDDLGRALAAIAGTYAGAADELLDLLVSNHVSSVPQVILDAQARGAPKAFIVWQLGFAPSADYFRAHDNAWWEYLAGPGAGLVASRTIYVRQQKLTGTSGGTTDCLHVFDVTFVLTPAAGGTTVTAELHNHVNTVSKRQTSLHFKGADKGRELSSASAISVACCDAVKSVPPTRRFQGQNPNRFPQGYTL